MRVGGRAIEFEKGKTAIVVPFTIIGGDCKYCRRGILLRSYGGLCSVFKLKSEAVHG